MGKIIALVILLLASASASAGWFGPDNYDDCVLEKMKDQKMKLAIVHARNACRKEFPLTLNLKAYSPPWDELSSSAAFLELSHREQEELRNAYFEDVIAPTVPPSELQFFRGAFDKITILNRNRPAGRPWELYKEQK